MSARTFATNFFIVLEQAPLAHGLLALIPGGERKRTVALEALEEVVEERHADLDPAFAGPRNTAAEQDRLDERPRLGHRLHRPPRTRRRGHVRLEPGLLPRERSGEGDRTRNGSPTCRSGRVRSGGSAPRPARATPCQEAQRVADHDEIRRVEVVRLRERGHGCLVPRAISASVSPGRTVYEIMLAVERVSTGVRPPRPKAVSVAGPKIPSTASPRERWNRVRADLVGEVAVDLEQAQVTGARQLGAAVWRRPSRACPARARGATRAAGRARRARARVLGP